MIENVTMRWRDDLNAWEIKPLKPNSGKQASLYISTTSGLHLWGEVIADFDLNCKKNLNAPIITDLKSHVNDLQNEVRRLQDEINNLSHEITDKSDKFHSHPEYAHHDHNH